MFARLTRSKPEGSTVDRPSEQGPSRSAQVRVGRANTARNGPSPEFEDEATPRRAGACVVRLAFPENENDGTCRVVSGIATLCRDSDTRHLRAAEHAWASLLDSRVELVKLHTTVQT